LRILLVDTTLMRPPTGGCQTFLVSLCAGLVEHGWGVHVVGEPGPDSSVAARLVDSGVKLHLDLWRPGHLPEERATRLASWVHRNEINAYVVSLSTDVGWLTLPFLDARITTMTIAHSDWSTFYAPLAYYAPFVDRAVGVSEQTHRRIVRDCGIPPERARHIPYGVEGLSRAQASQRWDLRQASGAPFRLGYVGRLEQGQKRVRDIASLVAELSRRRITFELDVIGDGEERPWLSRELADRGLSHLVRFWGWLSPEDVKRRLLVLDVLLLFSSTEGLPLALLEAMAHAVVPVVTEIDSGNPDVVRDAENGYLVPVGDIEVFGERLFRLATDRDRLARFKKAAWETGRQYSVERTTAAYIAALSEAAASVAGTSRAPRPPAPYPVMPSCRSSYPRWLRKLKWWAIGEARGIVTARGARRLRAAGRRRRS
jgi:glycosyltransferase involved in cell wall biosynthesis